MVELEKERKTLWELNPEKFTIPGGMDFDGKKLPDLTAKRDPVVRGLYRIELPPDFFSRRRE